MASPVTQETLRFGEFELDLGAYELRRDGRTVRLERQPMDLLILLVQRRRQLVSRAEIADRLWGKDVFVDVDTGVHTAIRKIRLALRDSSDTPAYVETVPGKGYRFIAPVEVVGAASPAGVPPGPDTAAAESAAAQLPLAGPGPPGGHAAPREEIARSRRWSLHVRVGVVVLAVVAAALGWAAWRGGWWASSPITLAVLPFENLSGDPGRDYLTEGLAEETIASLGQVAPDRLLVVARTSTLAYRGTSKSVAQIGRELGADYLVESSLRAEGGRLRITARLIRARDQVQVWSQSYDREPGSLLGVQQELSAAIAEQIRLRLSPERVDSLARREPGSADAYDLYLRGRNFENQRTPATTARAIEYYTRATQLDPDYALAWVGIARAHAASPLNGDADPREVVPRARHAAEQALRADPRLAEAQFAAGYVDWCCEWRWSEAEAALRRAVALDPRSQPVQVTFGHLLSQTGRHAEAREVMARARAIDPQSAFAHALSSQVAYQARDYHAALEHARASVVLDPEFWIGYIMQGQAQEALGDLDGALASLTQAARFSGQNSKTVSMRAHVLAKAGRYADAREVLRMLESLSQTKYVPPYALALIHAGLDEADAAFTWLERAYEARDAHLIFLTVEPRWDRFRRDPRFASLLRRCGFPTVPSSAVTGR